MKRTATLGLSLLVAAVLAGPAGATHTLPDPKPGAEPAPCGIHHELAAETIADPTMPGAKETQFQNVPDPFPPPSCTPAAAAP
jgi:hypothetical protein